MRLQIEQAGSDVLHSPARPVELDELRSDETQRLIDLMLTTLVGVGVGLAAPQVGVGLRIAVIEDRAEYHANVPDWLLQAQGRVPVEPHVLVNPVLTPTEDERVEFFEGCLSVTGFGAIVPRATGVHVKARDRFGEPFERDAHGWYARILQHEVDHLDGRLYLERMLPFTFATATSISQRWSKMPIEEAKRLFQGVPPEPST